MLVGTDGLWEARNDAGELFGKSRVAEAIARTETSIRKRGKLRVRMQIERAGISKAIARKAIDEVFGGIDDEAHIESALRKRLRGRDTIADDREFQRLYRFLIGQGFESDRALAALKNHKKRNDKEHEDHEE